MDVPEFLSLKTLLLKCIGACASVAASLPLGFQGVLLHIGGMIASLLATQLPHFELTCGAKREQHPHSSREPQERANHCMTAVHASERFSEYDSEPLLPFSAWRRRLPQLVEGLTRRIPGGWAPLSIAVSLHAASCSHIIYMMGSDEAEHVVTMLSRRVTAFINAILFSFCGDLGLLDRLRHYSSLVVLQMWFCTCQPCRAISIYWSSSDSLSNPALCTLTVLFEW